MQKKKFSIHLLTMVSHIYASDEEKKIIGNCSMKLSRNVHDKIYTVLHSNRFAKGPELHRRVNDSRQGKILSPR